MLKLISVYVFLSRIASTAIVGAAERIEIVFGAKTPACSRNTALDADPDLPMTTVGGSMRPSTNYVDLLLYIVNAFLQLPYSAADRLPST